MLAPVRHNLSKSTDSVTMPATARLPPALHPGDKVSIIAPSMSLSVITPEIRTLAEARLLSLKLQVGYGRHAADVGPNNTASIDARLADLHEAFADRHTACGLGGRWRCRR